MNNEHRATTNNEHRTINRTTLLASLTCCLLLSSGADAQVPHLIRYQGQAVDGQGVPLEGPYTLTFRLYDAETGGTKLWEEIQANVPLQGGHFSVLLGQVTSLAAMDWNRPCWLSVQVGTESELAPRQRITSVPMAIMAEELSVPVTTSTIADDANRLVPTGAIILWDGSSCPSGYTRVSALDGKFLVVNSTYDASAGGSNTKDLSHTHGAGSYTIPSHQHQFATSGTAHINDDPDKRVAAIGEFLHGNYGNQTGPAIQSHTQRDGGGGAVAGTSGTGGSTSLDIRPAYATVLLCKRD